MVVRQAANQVKPPPSYLSEVKAGLGLYLLSFYNITFTYKGYGTLILSF